MKGLIFSVKRYSVHDGPGIRVTIFMKGCPLVCWWCHNPEGLSADIETVYQINKVGSKKFRSTEQAGRYYSVNDILEILERERIFIDESKGGVTFSGGEPLMQTEFLEEALKECSKNGFHTSVDTSGYSSTGNFLKIIPWTNLFLFDIKYIEDSAHMKYTGVSNKLILDNFKLVLDSRKDIFIRIPVIPSVNDNPENLADLKQFISEHRSENLKKISLLPFHKTGKAKYQMFNVPYRMDNTNPPSRERMKELKDFFSETGIKVQIGG